MKIRNTAGRVLFEGNVDDICIAKHFTKANMSHLDLDGADLQNADMYQSTMRNSNIRNANLRDANLYGTDLRDTNLQYTDLRNADLRCVIAQGADFQSADLRGANLRNADLRGANFQHALMHDVSVEGALGVMTFGPFGKQKLVGFAYLYNGVQFRLGTFSGTHDELIDVIRKEYGEQSMQEMLIRNIAWTLSIQSLTQTIFD
jgi:uncharacterized protein YjbI with pentapeptide repeats